MLPLLAAAIVAAPPPVKCGSEFLTISFKDDVVSKVEIAQG
jgi:hypothetical protein